MDCSKLAFFGSVDMMDEDGWFLATATVVLLSILSSCDSSTTEADEIRSEEEAKNERAGCYGEAPKDTFMFVRYKIMFQHAELYFTTMRSRPRRHVISILFLTTRP
jgi:hypothetical protein